jgi:hypothetical protein
MNCQPFKLEGGGGGFICGGRMLPEKARELPRPAAAASEAARDGIYISHTCGFCGQRGGQYLRHYDIVRCSCGKVFWVLQPKRNGPLKLFIHPVLNGIPPQDLAEHRR